MLEREQAVIEEKSRNEGVPEAKLEGAVKGRLNAFYKDSVLLEQPSVKDPKVSIGKLVEELGGDAELAAVRAREGGRGLASARMSERREPGTPASSERGPSGPAPRAPGAG